MTPELQQAFQAATGTPFGTAWVAYAQPGRRPDHLYVSSSLREKLIDRGLDGVSVRFVGVMFEACGVMADALRFAPEGCNVVQLPADGLEADGDPEAGELLRALGELKLTLLVEGRSGAAFSEDDFPLECGYIRLG